MANLNAPHGLAPSGPLLSAKMYKIAAAYATALYINDPVVRNNQGDIIIATAGTGNAILGSALGFYTTEFAPLATNYYTASLAGVHYCLVADDPRQLFRIMEDSIGANYAAIDLAGNTNLVAGAGGSTVSGLSSWMADSSSAAGNTAGDQIRLIDVYRSADNAIGQYCQWIIRINNHQGLQGIVGVGI